MLTDKNVVIGVTGGIAAYKACELVSSLRKLNANVYVAMTKNAAEFVTPLTFEALSGNRVTIDSFDRSFDWEASHISFAQRADVFVIVPATANFIGKFARGIADDFLTSSVMATKAPVVICPAMNDGMYSSLAVQDNLKLLLSRNINIIDAEEGRLACGDTGKGRLAGIDVILERIKQILLPKQDLKKKQ